MSGAVAVLEGIAEVPAGVAATQGAVQTGRTVVSSLWVHVDCVIVLRRTRRNQPQQDE